MEGSRCPPAMAVPPWVDRLQPAPLHQVLGNSRAASSVPPPAVLRIPPPGWWLPGLNARGLLPHYSLRRAAAGGGQAQTCRKRWGIGSCKPATIDKSGTQEEQGHGAGRAGTGGSPAGRRAQMRSSEADIDDPPFPTLGKLLPDKLPRCSPGSAGLSTNNKCPSLAEASPGAAAASLLQIVGEMIKVVPFPRPSERRPPRRIGAAPGRLTVGLSRSSSSATEEGTSRERRWHRVHRRAPHPCCRAESKDHQRRTSLEVAFPILCPF